MTEHKIKSYFKNNQEEIALENASRVLKGSILFIAYLTIGSIVFAFTDIRDELRITYLSFLPFFIVIFLLVLLIKKDVIKNLYIKKFSLYAFIIVSFTFGTTLGLLDNQTNATMLPIFMIIIPLFLVVNVYHIFCVELVYTTVYLMFSYLNKQPTIFNSEILNMFAVLLVCIFIGSLHLKLRISESLATKKLKSLAKMDYLTSLPNRRSMDEYLNKQSTDNELYFMMIDIDGFKSINDTYGHLMGDEILQRIGSILYKYMSEETIVARYGGEEFLVVSNELNEQYLYKIASLIQRELKELVIPDLNEDVTVSVGVGKALIGEKYHVGIERADIALYVSKDSGKNKITIFKEEMNNERIEHDYGYKD